MAEEIITTVEAVEAVEAAPTSEPANKNERKFNRNNGQRGPRGRREGRGEKVSDGIDKKMVNVNRISKTVKGGRKMRFNAVVVAGDKKGRVGVGMGKATEVTLAIEKASVDAKRHMVEIALNGTTIPHEVVGQFETTRVILMPAKEGNGVIAGGKVRDVVELAGIKDITTKLYGSNNPVNSVKATFDGLMKLRSAEKIAALRGKAVEEIR